MTPFSDLPSNSVHTTKQLSEKRGSFGGERSVHWTLNGEGQRTPRAIASEKEANDQQKCTFFGSGSRIEWAREEMRRRKKMVEDDDEDEDGGSEEEEANNHAKPTSSKRLLDAIWTPLTATTLWLWASSRSSIVGSEGFPRSLPARALGVEKFGRVTGFLELLWTVNSVSLYRCSHLAPTWMLGYLCVWARELANLKRECHLYWLYRSPTRTLAPSPPTKIAGIKSSLEEETHNTLRGENIRILPRVYAREARREIVYLVSVCMWGCIVVPVRLCDPFHNPEVKTRSHHWHFVCVTCALPPQLAQCLCVSPSLLYVLLSLSLL